MSYVSTKEELFISSQGQIELLRGMTEQDLPLRMAARGSSMWPFVRDRDTITFAPLASQEPIVGEIVAAIPPAGGRLVVHRIVRNGASGRVIRGDNCRATDGIVDAELLLGRVVRVERRGHDVRLGVTHCRKFIALLSRVGILFWMARLLVLLRRTVSGGKRLTVA